MLDQIFLTKVILSVIIGGIWVTSSTLIVDKFGTKLGGLIAGLPSTAVIALLFIAISDNIDTAIRSTSVIPLAYSINAAFMLVYASLSKKGLLVAILPALIIWFLLSYLIIIFNFDNFIFGLIAWFLVLCASIYILENFFNSDSLEGQKIEYKNYQIAFRALFAGLVIGASVIASKLGGAIFGGILASFPAVFISTLIIVHKSRGPIVTIALTKSLLISGFINVISYSLAVRYLYGTIGVAYGTIGALVISLITGFLSYKFLIQKLK